MPINKIGGSYRINSEDYPVPTTAWVEQPIGAGLNGLPVNSSYKRHTWTWPFLLGEFAEQLFSAFDTQQSTNTQLDSLETDPYDASGAEATYGTTVYTDVKIVELTPRTRGLPFYDNVVVTFEVYVTGD